MNNPDYQFVGKTRYEIFAAILTFGISLIIKYIKKRQENNLNKQQNGNH
jgi:hypothetical protein